MVEKKTPLAKGEKLLTWLFKYRNYGCKTVIVNLVK